MPDGSRRRDRQLSEGVWRTEGDEELYLDELLALTRFGATTANITRICVNLCRHDEIVITCADSRGITAADLILALMHEQVDHHRTFADKGNVAVLEPLLGLNSFSCYCTSDDGFRVRQRAVLLATGTLPEKLEGNAQGPVWKSWREAHARWVLRPFLQGVLTRADRLNR